MQHCNVCKHKPDVFNQESSTEEACDELRRRAQPSQQNQPSALPVPACAWGDEVPFPRAPSPPPCGLGTFRGRNFVLKLLLGVCCFPSTTQCSCFRTCIIFSRARASQNKLSFKSFILFWMCHLLVLLDAQQGTHSINSVPCCSLAAETEIMEWHFSKVVKLDNPCLDGCSWYGTFGAVTTSMTYSVVLCGGVWASSKWFGDMGNLWCFWGSEQVKCVALVCYSFLSWDDSALHCCSKVISGGRKQLDSCSWADRKWAVVDRAGTYKGLVPREMKLKSWAITLHRKAAADQRVEPHFLGSVQWLSKAGRWSCTKIHLTYIQETGTCGTEGHRLAGMVVLGWQLDWIL